MSTASTCVSKASTCVSKASACMSTASTCISKASTCVNKASAYKTTASTCGSKAPAFLTTASTCGSKAPAYMTSASTYRSNASDFDRKPLILSPHPLNIPPVVKIFYFSFTLLFFVSSCSLTVDEPKAKQLVENLLNDLKNENFSGLDKYYVSSFNESEPVDKKIEKYNRLKEVIGPIVSYEFINATEKYDDYSNINFIELLYNVKGKKLTVKKTFRVMNDAGDLKITYQNIENLK